MFPENLLQLGGIEMRHLVIHVIKSVPNRGNSNSWLIGVPWRKTLAAPTPHDYLPYEGLTSANQNNRKLGTFDGKLK